MKRNHCLAALVMAAAFTLQLSPEGRLALAAAHAESETLRPEVGKPLQAAQELIKARKYKEALAKVKEADAAGSKTGFEALTINRMRAVAAIGAGDAELAAQSVEAVISSGRVAGAEQLPLIEAVTGMYYRAKDYHKAIAWSQRYLKQDADNAMMRTLLIQSQYLTGDYAAVAKELNAEFRADDKAGKVPGEDRLRMLADSYRQLDDNAGYVAVLERLVAHYPKKDYWADLLARLQKKPGFSDRLLLDVMRLQFATGTLASANDFMVMAQLAMQAGFPVEAKKVIDKAYESGVFGSGPEAERHQRLRKLADTKAAEDQKALNDAQDAAAKTGIALVNTGYDYVINGKFDKGIAMMERGVNMGDIKRAADASLHMGIAYLLAGQKANALQAFKSVQGADGTADLARYWAIHASQPAR